jgi:hypothetical protein
VSFSIRLDQFKSKGKGPKGTSYTSLGRNQSDTVNKEIKERLDKIEAQLEAILARLNQ